MSVDGPAPREHELPSGDLAVSSHWVWGVRDATTVPADSRPLYRLLMDLLDEVHVPDTMPAVLASACTDLVDVRETVMAYHRGYVDVGGHGYGMSFCHRVRDAIDAHRDRDPLTLVVVGCSGSKRDVAAPVAAKDLYSGGYWTNKQTYGETVADDLGPHGDDGWRIISAEHAVVHPRQELGYYQRTPDDLAGVPVDSDARLPSGERVTTLLDQWAVRVHEGLAAWLDDVAGAIDPRDVRLEVLLGEAYEGPLRERAVFDRLSIPGNLTVSFPFREVGGLTGIGRQRSYMAARVAEEQAVSGGS